MRRVRVLWKVGVRTLMIAIRVLVRMKALRWQETLGGILHGYADMMALWDARQAAACFLYMSYCSAFVMV
jgi:hypothetical protein